MDTLSGKKCKNCVYMKEIGIQDHGQIGQQLSQCYRYPPTMQIVQQGNQMGMTPIRPAITPDGEACGEHVHTTSIMDTLSQ